MVLAMLVSVFFQYAQAAMVSKNAIVQKISVSKNTWTLVLDYVEYRECNCDTDFEIVNQNPRLRTFQLAPKAKILLLKDVSKYFDATPTQLLEGLAGKDFGWKFDRYNPFSIRLDEKNSLIYEIRQDYLP